MPQITTPTTTTSTTSQLQQHQQVEPQPSRKELKKHFLEYNGIWTKRFYRTATLILERPFRLAQVFGLVDDYFIDIDGMNYDNLIEVYSPKYDEPASGLPRFAAWTQQQGQYLSRFLKVGCMTIITTKASQATDSTHGTTPTSSSQDSF